MDLMMKGHEARLRLKEHSTFGTLPTGNWNQATFYSEGIATGESLVEDQELGFASFTQAGPRTPGLGLPDVSGQLAVPLDLSQIGYWLKALMGAPTTTGTTPNFTHTYTSGKTAVSLFALEFAPGAGATEHKIVNSACVQSMEIDFTPVEGFLRAQLGLIARNVQRAQSTVAGTPAALPVRAKYPGTGALLKINGTQAGAILGGVWRYANGATAERYVDGSRFVGDIDVGFASCSCSPRVRARRSQATLLDLFDGLTAFSVDLEFTVGTNLSMVISHPAMRAAPVALSVDGPGGLEFTPEFVAADAAAAAAVTVTLKNQIASYPA